MRITGDMCTHVLIVFVNSSTCCCHLFSSYSLCKSSVSGSVFWHEVELWVPQQPWQQDTCLYPAALGSLGCSVIHSYCACVCASGMYVYGPHSWLLCMCCLQCVSASCHNAVGQEPAFLTAIDWPCEQPSSLLLAGLWCLCMTGVHACCKIQAR